MFVVPNFENILLKRLFGQIHVGTSLVLPPEPCETKFFFRWKKSGYANTDIEQERLRKWSDIVQNNWKLFKTC